MNLRRRSSCAAACGLAAALTLAGWPAGAAAAGLQVTVLRQDGQPLPGAVVLLHGPPGTPPPAPTRAVVDQIDREFRPDLVIVPVGSQVVFPNTDSVSHQVYSFSPAKRFQLPLYKGTPYPPVVFDRAGIATLGCNIHDSMIAYVVVTDAPWSGRTDRGGSWHAVGLATGEYQLEIWHPRMREPDGSMERAVSLDGAHDARLEVRLSRSLRPEPLGQKPRSWSDY